MVNSMSGHRVAPGKLRFYSATKFAVTGLLEGWRQEVNDPSAKYFHKVLKYLCTHWYMHPKLYSDNTFKAEKHGATK